MTFREMSVEDLEQVVEIEKALFSDPWTKEGFFTFLTKENTMFFVVEEKEKILAYCSMQTVLDEGDILNVAVRSDSNIQNIAFIQNCLHTAIGKNFFFFFNYKKHGIFFCQKRKKTFFRPWIRKKGFFYLDYLLQILY